MLFIQAVEKGSRQLFLYPFNKTPTDKVPNHSKLAGIDEPALKLRVFWVLQNTWDYIGRDKYSCVIPHFSNFVTPRNNRNPVPFIKEQSFSTIRRV